MPHQINPSVTNPTIADVYQAIVEDRLVLRPDFQRKFVWTHDHQEDFIDTILNGLPFPEIYTCKGPTDVQNLRTTRNVIDGQQRLTTIRNYILGKHERALSKVPSYESLSNEKKQDFVNYKIVVRDIGEVDDETVREIFRRINLTKFKLDTIEIQNAIYDGQFIRAAKEILDNIDLREYGVLKDSEFSRMADLHFVILVMATIENDGYFAQNREVEPKIAEFNEEYRSYGKMVSRLNSTFSILTDLNLPSDSMWLRKSNFFTLVVETALKVDEIPADYLSKLQALEQNVMNNKLKPDTEFGQYYSYMYQATHGRKARVVRSDLFRKYVLN